MLVSFLIAALIFVLLLVFWSLQKNTETNIIKTFWSKFQTMFVESNEDNLWSANRFSYVFTMFISNLVMWGAVLFLVINSLAFPEIPNGIIMIYGISNGVASIAKVWQKREERFVEEIGSTERQNSANNESEEKQNMDRLNASK